MSNGFVLILLREIRESILKLREELDQRLERTNERLDQTAASLGRVESEIHELQKFLRQIALNQAKQEQARQQSADPRNSETSDLREQLRRLKAGQ